jgi:multiple sugar transport system permease protein
MVGPSMVLAGGIIAYPLWELFLLSTHQVSRFGIVQQYTGAHNLDHVLADPALFATLARTGVWTVVVVGLTVLIAAGVALVLNQEFRGRAIARALVMLPWAVSVTMLTVVWRWALAGQGGMVNLTLQELGLLRVPVVWLAQANTAFPLAMAIGVLVSIPFTATIFLGGLSSLPGEIYEAASIDGASLPQQFFRITLPLMRPYLNLAIVLNVIYVFNAFSVVWVLTEGGPADSTDVIVTYLFKLAFVFGRLGDAGAVSLLTFATLLVLTFIYLRLSRQAEA